MESGIGYGNFSIAKSSWNSFQGLFTSQVFGVQNLPVDFRISFPIPKLFEPVKLILKFKKNPQMKYLATLLFVLWSLNIHAQVEIVAEKDTEKNITLIAFNQDVIPFTIRIEFVKLENLESWDGNVIYAVAKPGKTNLVKLRSPYLNAKTSFNYNSKVFKGSYSTGDTLRLPPYLIPVDQGQVVNMRPLTTQSGMERIPEGNRYVGVGFIFENPAVICAPRKGIISEIKKDQTNQAGGHVDFDAENFIEIYHQDGSFSRLTGLKANSAKVEVGDTVFPGQPIAESNPVTNVDEIQVKMIQSRWQKDDYGLIWINFPVILTDGQNQFPSNSAAINLTASHPEEWVILEMDKKEVKNYFKK